MDSQNESTFLQISYTIPASLLKMKTKLSLMKASTKVFNRSSLTIGAGRKSLTLGSIIQIGLNVQSFKRTVKGMIILRSV